MASRCLATPVDNVVESVQRFIGHNVSRVVCDVLRHNAIKRFCLESKCCSSVRPALRSVWIAFDLKQAVER